MRKILLPVLIAAPLAVSCGCHAIQAGHIELTERQAFLVETPMGSGSGFPITENAYMTAAHVVEGWWGAEQVEVDGMTAQEIIVLEGLDVALIVMAEPHGHARWPIEERAPRPGERVFKSGYGQGIHWWTEGFGTEDPDRVAIDIFHGDSGCPLFDRHGTVLGVVVSMGGYGMEGRVMHHCWIVPMSEIIPALPEGFLAPLIEPEPVPVDPLPAEETPWERFLRLKKERGL